MGCYFHWQVLTAVFIPYVGSKLAWKFGILGSPGYQVALSCNSTSGVIVLICHFAWWVASDVLLSVGNSFNSLAFPYDQLCVAFGTFHRLWTVCLNVSISRLKDEIFIKITGNSHAHQLQRPLGPAQITPYSVRDTRGKPVHNKWRCHSQEWLWQLQTLLRATRTLAIAMS